MSRLRKSTRLLLQLSLFGAIAAAATPALADRASLEAAKAARERAAAAAKQAAIEAAKAGARAAAEAKARFGMSCPQGFASRLTGDTLLCELRTQIPVAMNQCPAGFPTYHTRAGRQDACTKPNFLAEGVLEERFEEGTHYVYATEDAQAIERAKQLLEAGLGGQPIRLQPPQGLKDAARFQGRTLTVAQVPQERIVAATNREFKLDGLAASGEDATVVHFVIYTAPVKSR